MRFIYFLRTRTAYVVLVLMSIVCAGALFVAGSMTIVAYNKQNQEINSPEVVSGTKTEPAKSKMPNLKGINEIALYYNGVRVDGLYAFSTSKGELLFPIDDLFKYIGLEYNYYSSDGIFEAKVYDCDVVIKIWADTFKINNTEYPLPYAGILSNDRIMVPLEVLNKINGFSVTGSPLLSTVYVNYNSNYLSEAYKKVFYVSQSNQTQGIYNAYGDRFMNAVDTDNTTGFSYSSAREAVLYTKGQNSYLLYKSLNFAPAALNLEGSSRWTEDKRSVYVPLNNFNTLKIYSPDSGKIIQLDGVRDIISANSEFKGFSNGALSLVSYWSYDKTIRISVKNTKTDEVCTILYNKNKPAIVAKAWMSPTGAYMAYMKDGEYRVCTYDGSRDAALDNAMSINWITDNLIMLYKDSLWQVYNVLTGHIESRDNSLGFLGQAGDNEVLFKDSKAIYKSADGKETKVLDLLKGALNTDRVNLNSAVAAPGLYSIIAGDAYNNSVYLIYGSVLTKVGEYNSLLKSSKDNVYMEDLKRSVKISPDGKTYTLVQADKDSVRLIILAADGSWTKEIRLDSDVYLKNRYGTGDINYIDNDKLVYNDSSSIWLINFDRNTQQISQLSNKDGRILGVMIK